VTHLFPWRPVRAAFVALCALVAASCDEVARYAGSGAAQAGCGPDEICDRQGAERVRAIKPYVVTQLASGAERRFSGEVVAANSAPLSFPVGGRVLTIEVSAGDAAGKGDLLATLDAAPFELNVEAARADLSAARSARRALEADLKRQRELRKNGWVSEAALDQVEVEYESAGSQVSIAQSRLALAERDLASTRMLAPFSGVVSSVNIDPFTEVVSGQAVLVMQSSDAFEVVVSVPDAAVSRLAPGAPVAMDVSTLPLCGCRGAIVEIGAVSSAGNAVDVVVSVTEAPAGLRAGMSAEVAITLGGGERTAGYFVPLSAIAPGETADSAVVYRFDAEEGGRQGAGEGVVRRVPVRFVGGIAAEAVAVEGLEAGDVVAAAGVSFLRDGQRVRLLGTDG